MRILLFGLLSYLLLSFVPFDHITCPDEIQIANAFTPNGDGNNDTFKIDWTCEPEEFEISIFNNWDELVFVSEHSYFEWEGKLDDGTFAPAGVYNYAIHYKFMGKEYAIENELVLMR